MKARGPEFNLQNHDRRTGLTPQTVLQLSRHDMVHTLPHLHTHTEHTVAISKI